MPATGAFSGTPALSSDSVDAQTEPIEVEPLEPSASETWRIAYGNSSRAGQHRHQRPLGQRAVADLAPLRRAHPAGLTGRVRREVVVVHVALGASPARACRASAPCRSMFSVVTPRIWVSPRSNSAEPWARGSTSTSADSCRMSRRAAAVDADLVAQDALADQLLGQRPERGGRPRFSRPSNVASAATASTAAALIRSSSASRSCLPAIVSASASSPATAASTAA